MQLIHLPTTIHKPPMNQHFGIATRNPEHPNFRGFPARVLRFSKTTKADIKDLDIVTKLRETRLYVLTVYMVLHHAQGYETIGVFPLKFCFCDSFCGGFSTHRY